MEYFEEIGLTREPFSNSPDPDMFFCSDKQKHCLQQLEISIRLRRGVNVVLGEVGTGKTTIFRRLLQNLDDLECHPFLDPDIGSIKDFLALILAKLTGEKKPLEAWEYKEQIKRALLTKNLIENKTVVLLIDEGQKLSRQGIEFLRELLNFETNTSKLLQVVIFAQPEFKRHLDAMYNFTDRINFLYEIKRFDYDECKKMIINRLEHSSLNTQTPKYFTNGAIKKIHIQSKGRPRQIITLCHKLLLQMTLEKKKRISAAMVDNFFGHTSGNMIFLKYSVLGAAFFIFIFINLQIFSNKTKTTQNLVQKQPILQTRWEIKKESNSTLY